MTQEQCERAVKALQKQGFNASYVPIFGSDDHGVWIDSVWDNHLRDTASFRLHNEEIEWWAMATTPFYPADIKKDT